MSSLTYPEARALVIADQRRSDDADDYSDAELIEYVRDVIALPNAYAVGGYPVDDDGSDTSLAYCLIIATEDESARITRFDPTQTSLKAAEARGHKARTGHDLQGFYIIADGLATLTRTCDHRDI